MPPSDLLPDAGAQEVAFAEALRILRVEYERVLAENKVLRPIALSPRKSVLSSEDGLKENKGNKPQRHVGFTEEFDVQEIATEKDKKVDRKSSLAQETHERPSVRRSVFMSTEDVATSLKPIIDGADENIYGSSSTCARIALHPHFQTMNMVMIIVYAIWMGIDADWNSALLITDANFVFQMADHFFCFYFAAELVLRYFAYRRCRDRAHDPWFVFDAILVPLTIFDTWVMTIVALATPVDQREAAFVRRTEILRSFRILRLTRICRMAKLVRFFPELQILIKAMLTAFRSVFFALILLLASHYMIAIAYHVTLEETEVGKAAFGSVLASMQTLFVHCTMLDEIITLIDQFITESLYAHLLCMYFVMFINAITLMNILIGIVVEVISNVAIAEREMVNVRWVQDVINQFLGNAEVLEQSELMDVLDQAPALKALKLLGVDVGILKEMVTAYFTLEEVPKDTDHQMPMAEFVELVMQLRGANTATVKDMVDLRKWMDDSQQALALRLEFMVAKLREKRSLTGRRKKGQTASAQDGSEARRGRHGPRLIQLKVSAALLR